LKNQTDDTNGKEFKGINSQNIRYWSLKKEINLPCLIQNLIGHVLNPLKVAMIYTMTSTYGKINANPKPMEELHR